MNMRLALILVVAWIVSGCASPPHHKAYPVLEPMDQPSAVKEEEIKPQYQKLANLLLSLGYEPVGMQFETDANLDLLYTVFSNPIAQQRMIKLVYTGLQMSYDKVAESLTVGGMTSVTSILSYVQRNVPVNKVPAIPLKPLAPKAVPTQSGFSKPTPIPIPTAVPTPAPPPAASSFPSTPPASILKPGPESISAPGVDPVPSLAPIPSPIKTKPDLIPDEEIPVE